MKGKILILDDNRSVLIALEMLLQTEFEEVYTLRNPSCLVSTIQKHRIDIVLLDMNFKAGINTGNEGIYWLHEIQKYDPTISVVMITAYGDVTLAVKAVNDVWKATGLPIVGTGGVTTGEDAIEMMMAGAGLVGIGTMVYYRGAEGFGEVVKEMDAWCEKEGVKDLKEIIGII